MKIKALSILTAAILFTGCSQSGPAIEEVGAKSIMEETVAIDGLDQIVIQSENIDITVEEEDREDVLVYLKTSTNGADLEMVEGDTSLTITTVEPESVQINIINTGGPHLTVMVPKDYDGDLNLVTDGGDVDLKTLTLKDIRLSLESGDLESRDVKSQSVLAELGKGEAEIDLDGYEGSFEADTNGGKINVHENGDKYKHEDSYMATFGNSDQIFSLMTSGGDVEVYR